MFYIVHILAGATIAKFFPNILLIIILSLLSHFIIDIIPHKDSFSDKGLFKKKYEIKLTKRTILLEIADIFISILLIIYIYMQFNSSLMLLAIFISLLPDIARIGYITKLKNNKTFKKYMCFHSKIQKEVSWKLGLLAQTIATIILIKTLF